MHGGYTFMAPAYNSLMCKWTEFCFFFWTSLETHYSTWESLPLQERSYMVASKQKQLCSECLRISPVNLLLELSVGVNEMFKKHFGQCCFIFASIHIIIQKWPIIFVPTCFSSSSTTFRFRLKWNLAESRTCPEWLTHWSRKFCISWPVTMQMIRRNEFVDKIKLVWCSSERHCGTTRDTARTAPDPERRRSSLVNWFTHSVVADGVDCSSVSRSAGFVVSVETSLSEGKIDEADRRAKTRSLFKTCNSTGWPNRSSSMRITRWAFLANAVK